VIVDKTARQLPFGETVGVGGSLAFMLKDNSGTVRRQLVTPEVFARYEIGDYFNDMQPGPTRQPGSSDGKTMLTATNSRPHAAARTASVRKKNNAGRVAKKAAKKQQAIAATKRVRAKKIVPTVKPEQAPRVAAAAPVKADQERAVAAVENPTGTQVAYVGVTRVARCR